MGMWDHLEMTTWEHLADLAPGEPNTISLEEFWVSIGQLALQSEAPIQGVREQPIETATVEEGPDNQTAWAPGHSRGTHCSSTPLAGLATITPCWDKTLGHAREQEEGVWHITGLTFRYEDGRARVLGEFRLDSLVQPYDITTCDGVSLKYVWERTMLENLQLGRVREDG